MKYIENLRDELNHADAIVIGAGAGLSTSAGFTYTGRRFYDNFGDMSERYGYKDMYSGGFYSYETLGEMWAFWARYIMVNRYQDPPKPVYDKLLDLVANKDYFVLTTNVDHCFQRAGFDKQRLFYTQGDYGLWQCSEPCHQKTYDNEETVRAMYAEEKDMKVPLELVPRCPVCGKPMTMNLRSDMTFVEDEGWHVAAERYRKYLRNHKAGHILFLELGVGGNTPSIIKYPFWRMTNDTKGAVYACVNYGEAFVPEEITDRAIAIDGDIGEVIHYLKGER